MKNKILLSILVGLVFFILFSRLLPRMSYAQTNQYYNQYTAPQTSPGVAYLPSVQQQQTLHTYAQNVIIEVLVGISCQITGVDPSMPDGKCLTLDQATGRMSYQNTNGGAIGFMGNMIAATFEIPVSTHAYVADIGSRFGIVKNTYADAAQDSTESTGFVGLKPFLPLWTAFRNIVYLIFVLLFVIIGLAIMLRLKVDARTVMTIQNQIPKIVIGLILITFSYAIAAFLIDMMWLSCYLIYNIIVGSGVNHLNITDLNPTHLQGKNPFSAIGGFGGIGRITADSSAGVGEVIKSLFDGTIGHIIGAALGAVIGTLVAGPFGGIAGGLFGLFGGTQIIGLIGTIIAFVVIGAAILISLFRLWFALLRAYIFILFDVVMAPFWIAAAILPGSPLGFGKWLRDVGANLAAFPATIFLFMLAKAIMDSVGKVQKGDQFVPPLIGNPGQPNAIASLIGMGIILISPQVVTMTKDALKAPQNKYSAGLGQSLGAGVGVMRAGTGQVMSRLAPKDQQGNIGGVVGGLLHRGSSSESPAAKSLSNFGRMLLGGRGVDNGTGERGSIKRAGEMGKSGSNRLWNPSLPKSVPIVGGASINAPFDYVGNKAVATAKGVAKAPLYVAKVPFNVGGKVIKGTAAAVKGIRNIGR